MKPIINEIKSVRSLIQIAAKLCLAFGGQIIQMHRFIVWPLASSWKLPLVCKITIRVLLWAAVSSFCWYSSFFSPDVHVLMIVCYLWDFLKVKFSLNIWEKAKYNQAWFLVCQFGQLAVGFVGTTDFTAEGKYHLQWEPTFLEFTWKLFKSSQRRKLFS